MENATEHQKEEHIVNKRNQYRWMQLFSQLRVHYRNNSDFITDLWHAATGHQRRPDKKPKPNNISGYLDEIPPNWVVHGACKLAANIKLAPIGWDGFTPSAKPKHKESIEARPVITEWDGFTPSTEPQRYLDWLTSEQTTEVVYDPRTSLLLEQALCLGSAYLALSDDAQTALLRIVHDMLEGAVYESGGLRKDSLESNYNHLATCASEMQDLYSTHWHVPDYQYSEFDDDGDDGDDPFEDDDVMYERLHSFYKNANVRRSSERIMHTLQTGHPW